MEIISIMRDYEVRELEIICDRIGGKFDEERQKCILDHVNDELRSNYYYNGYSNYETWATSLFINNDEGIYNLIHNDIIPDCREEAKTEDNVKEGIWTEKQAIQFCIADRLKDMIEENEPELKSPYAELLRTDKVDWDEIAKSEMEE